MTASTMPPDLSKSRRESLLHRLLPSFGYVGCVALSSTLIALYSSKASTSTMLLTSTATAVLVYHVANLRRIVAAYRHAATEWRSVVALNLAVLVGWATAYRGYDLVGSAGFMYLFCLSIALTSTARALLLGPNRRQSAVRLVVGGGLLVSYVFVDEGHGRLLEGYALALLGGGATFAYFVVSEGLHARSGMSPLEVLMVRFHALLVYAALLSAPWTDVLRLSPSDLMVMIGIGLTTFVVPIYAAQVGIQRIGADRHAMVVSTTPFFTFLTAYLLVGTWSVGLFALSALGSCYLAARRRSA